ncbi:MAG: hypothetical protein FGM58_08885 [Acidimicrobiia bacterium]|nr:hypothetical protein [Acidimicrobiia bacterium]
MPGRGFDGVVARGTVVDGVADPRAEPVDGAGLGAGAGVEVTMAEPGVDAKAAPAAMVRPRTPTAPTLPTATARRDREAG